VRVFLTKIKDPQRLESGCEAQQVQPERHGPEFVGPCPSEEARHPGEPNRVWHEHMRSLTLRLCSSWLSSTLTRNPKVTHIVFQHLIGLLNSDECAFCLPLPVVLVWVPSVYIVHICETM
jgi:hypothetical protein